MQAATERSTCSSVGCGGGTPAASRYESKVRTSDAMVVLRKIPSTVSLIDDQLNCSCRLAMIQWFLCQNLQYSVRWAESAESVEYLDLKLRIKWDQIGNKQSVIH